MVPKYLTNPVKAVTCSAPRLWWLLSLSFCTMIVGIYWAIVAKASDSSPCQCSFGRESKAGLCRTLLSCATKQIVYYNLQSSSSTAPEILLKCFHPLMVMLKLWDSVFFLGGGGTCCYWGVFAHQLTSCSLLTKAETAVTSGMLSRKCLPLSHSSKVSITQAIVIIIGTFI